MSFSLCRIFFVTLILCIYSFKQCPEKQIQFCMPEHAEIRIMSDFVNHHAKNRTFHNLFHVERGNNPLNSNLIHDFKLSASTNGKQLILHLKNDSKSIIISVFMGMTGNWKWVDLDSWNETKFIRMRLDTDNKALILYGAYMGPKYKIGPFTGVKRGPDPVFEFDEFKKNILLNLSKRDFSKNLAEVLLCQKYFNGVGAYLAAEILGRSDLDPFLKFDSLTEFEISSLLELVKDCCQQAYEYGGGELVDWYNPFGGSNIQDFIKFYSNKDLCLKHKFGNRNLWIQKKWIYK